MNWTQLRLEDEASPNYRRAVHELAERLSEILNRASEMEPTTQEEALIIDEEAGIVDQLAEMEDALPRVNQHLTGFAKVTEDIGAHLQWATDELKNQTNVMVDSPEGCE
ncbi:hypothetical protein ACFQ1B_16335 [Streptomyces mexicanus]